MDEGSVAAYNIFWILFIQVVFREAILLRCYIALFPWCCVACGPSQSQDGGHSAADMRTTMREWHLSVLLNIVLSNYFFFHTN